MRISECREEDVAVLDQHMPFLSAGARHAGRFARQREGTATLLVAWRDGGPVGSCEVRWDGCEAPEVRAAHPGCPEVNGLSLWPEALRSQEVSSALLGAAEERAAARGSAHLGLGVEKNNPRAEALYKSLGYLPSVPYLDCWSYEDGEGVGHRVADACVFMVKALPDVVG
ncbi:GNAT family N-acetyltransferase [Streptomyces sp. ODS28]|uniref:GNAT family N-acetyltransferase n=1 Tax=Streptomyces sp. ODS28 TaxID=3136688 RepID=UPI0031F07992